MSIEDVKQLSDTELNIKLCLSLDEECKTHKGYPDRVIRGGNFVKFPTRYCYDIAKAREAQAKAIELDAERYVNNLYNACYGFERPDDHSIDELNVTHLLQATPRQISGAAYLTLKG
ncbi:hypothetical protein D3C74_294870 [compost metagenome]